MNNIKITIGISGAGKSTFCRKNFPDYLQLDMDDIRKELTGDVSDQSMNKEVFSIFNQRLSDALNKNLDICIANTNLKLKDIKSTVALIPKEYLIEFILFEDSLNWEKCRDRVQFDIETGVDRSVTYNVERGGMPLIEYMSEQYKVISNSIKSFVENLKDQGFSVIYRKV